MKACDQVYNYYNVKTLGFKKPMEEHQTLTIPILIKEISDPILRKLQDF